MSTPLPAKTTAQAVIQPRELHALVESYAITLSWPLLIKNHNVYMPTNLGIVGLSMTAGIGGEVNTEFKRRNMYPPIVIVPGTPSRWIFLVEAPSAPSPTVPGRVDVLTGTHLVPLPPSVIGGVAVRWLTTPTDDRVHLPAYTPSIGAVRQVALASTV